MGYIYLFEMDTFSGVFITGYDAFHTLVCEVVLPVHTYIIFIVIDDWNGELNM